MIYRDYNPEKDKDAAHQIWLEVGWIEKDNPTPMDILVDNSRTIVADLNGHPECLALSLSGDFRHLNSKIPLSCVGGVTTSLIARKQNLAIKLTAEKIALDASNGAMIGGLVIFDQGYYDKLGYGSGSYEHIIKFSPSTLNLKRKPGIPIRISNKDWELVYNSRINRLRCHGSCSISVPEQTKAEMLWTKNGFGYGYLNDMDELSHFIWMDGKGKENGPFNIEMMAYRNYDQFMELLALIQSFGDQVRLVSMIEPPCVQMQDFISKPFLHKSITEGSKFQNSIKASAFFQMRICDLPGCLEKTHLKGESVIFNLKLSDPIEKYLDDEFSWRGVGGDYIISLGEQSSAEIGYNAELPTLETSVGVFTRMWVGALPASTLVTSGELSAPDTLLKSLDEIFRLPVPSPDWMF